MFINDLTGEEIDGAFYEKEQPKTNKKKNENRKSN